jgi:hypothetical protein
MFKEIPMSKLSRVAAPAFCSLLAALVASPLVGCGDVEDMTAGPDGGVDPGADAATDPGPDASPTPDPDGAPDVTAPTIVSTTPEDGATAVAENTDVVIVFSEPMDTAAVEGAYNSDDLPPPLIDMSWNEAGDTLTISSEDVVVYAEGVGTDPDTVDARVYALTLDADRTRDLAGNSIAETFELSFSTQKRMSATFDLVNDDSLVSIDGEAGNPQGAFFVGDTNKDVLVKSFLTFDLLPLPGSATAIESASFSARPLTVTGTPYADLGELKAQHVSYDAVDQEAFDAAPLAVIGTFSADDSVESKSIDVTDAVKDDFDHLGARDGKSQYRLQFARASDGHDDDDLATFARDTFSMDVVYLAE